MRLCSSRRFAAAGLAAACVALAGCAGGVTRWMVDLRTSQGDSALARTSLVEAQKEYSLALALDPKDARARSGLAEVLFLQARDDFAASKLDQAETEIAASRTYAPGAAAVQDLADQIEQARIRKEIVLANYPLYASVGSSLDDSLKTLVATQREIGRQLKAFGADFDTGHLTKAIIAAYDLEDGAHRVTLRLITYRGLVSSGAPKPSSPTQAETPNLLPVP